MTKESYKKVEGGQVNNSDSSESFIFSRKIDTAIDLSLGRHRAVAEHLRASERAYTTYTAFSMAMSTCEIEHS